MVKDYSSLDYGTKPSTSILQEVHVVINPELLVKDYAHAYIAEAKRRNPNKFVTPIHDPSGEEKLRITSGLDLTEEELYTYFKGILKIRVDSTRDEGTKDWRIAKRLFIPDFLEFAISQVGVVIDHIRGLKFIPVMEEQYDMKQLLVTSNKVSSLIDDGINASEDAFPRKREGDPDVMGFAIIQDYVMGQNAIQHPLASYAAAFLGLKLKEESTFQLLYRVRYDDIDFIREMLIYDRRIY